VHLPSLRAHLGNPPSQAAAARPTHRTNTELDDLNASQLLASHIRISAYSAIWSFAVADDLTA